MNCNLKQLSTEFIETRKVSYPIKFTAFLFSLIFASIPLAELVYEFDYNHIKSSTTVTCIVGDELYFQPLEFRELRPKE